MTTSAVGPQPPLTARRTMPRALALARDVVPVPAVLVVALVAVALDGSDFYLSIAGAAIVYAVAALGQGILIGRTGQVSLGGAALMAVGAYTAALATQNETLAAFPVPIVLAALAGAVVGAIVAVPGLRFKGLYLLLATLALQYVVQFCAQRLEQRPAYLAGVTVKNGSGSSLVSAGLPFAETALVILILLYVATKLAYRGQPGRVLAAIGENEVAAATMGIDVRRWKVAAFIVSSAVTAVAGALFAYYIGVVTSASFDFTLAITILIMTFVGGAATAGGPLIGAVVVTIFPYVTNSLADHAGADSWLATNMPFLQVVVYGLALTLVLLYARGGLAGIDLGATVRFLRRPGGERTARRAARPARTAVSTDTAQTPALLSVTDLSVRYRGDVTGVQDVSLTVAAGEIVAVVGRNGAGKTSLLRGIVGPARRGDFFTDGAVVFAGHPLQGAGRMPPGLAYVAEQVKVFPGLSVQEHFALVGASPRDVEESLDRANLAPLKQRLGSPAGLLSGGERQFVALVGALLREPKLLLVDEMSLGLAPIAVNQVVEAIARIRDLTGAGVVVVDQNVAVLSRIADRVVIMENGRIAWQGPTADVDVERVESAYLGLRREVHSA